MTLTTSLFLVVSTLSTVAATNCPALSDTDRAKLAVYVQKKYKLDGMVGIKELPNIDDSCYRRLEFSGDLASTGKRFRVTLIASPDLRFLMRELLDVRVDPIEEAKKEALVLAQKLDAPYAASLGSKEAPVTMVIFSDFQCPFCSAMAKGLMTDILPANGEKIRVVFRHFPLPMHPWARAAAEATACAAQQNSNYFWPLHDYLFTHQREIASENLISKLSEQAATVGGFDDDQFKTCVNQHQTAAQIDQDIAAGKAVAVRGTPTLFVNGQRVPGYVPQQIRTLINELSRKETTTAVNP